MAVLSLIHFNDVYRVTPQKITPKETIDVTQFGALIDSIRDLWPTRTDGQKDGLTLFSGDLFSPSVESSVTRGSHMVPVMNILAPDVSLTGNHDFDFGYPHLTKLIRDCTFPWILSNIIDTTTGKVPSSVHEFQVLERCGMRIGVIGLVEREWIGTVATWPETFEYRDMKETGLDLSQRLRDPNGEHRCDFIIALTHSRVPNDITLAKDLLALSSSAQEKNPIHGSHGCDLLLGGHDHLYWISRGVDSWDNYDLNEVVLGAEQDHGDILVIKSGMDFRDLSEFNIELEDSPPGSVRRMVIKRITGKRHTITSDMKSSEKLTELLKTLLSSVSETLKAPVCTMKTTLDVRSRFIRTAESAACNWFADVARHAYDETLLLKGVGGSDCVLLCAGTFRGDSMYSPGFLTLGDVLEILPFEDPLVVLELDGAAIWDAIEASLSTWPAQEGRFPVISGFRVSWDSRRKPGNRVIGIWLLKEKEDSEHSQSNSGSSTPLNLDAEPIERTKDGRKYVVVTREYMAEGHDGFLALKGKEYLVDDESGQMFSTIVRKYLMGSHYVNTLARLVAHPSTEDLQQATKDAVRREKNRRVSMSSQQTPKAIQHWKQAVGLASEWTKSRKHYQLHLNVCTTEHMSAIDHFDGQQARTGIPSDVPRDFEGGNEDLLVVSPSIDGRLKNEGRA
ncbi:Metallo-dependent phosphatase-like protein [Mycena floridula]|nr:Metallo-dependent phosphatase-like protein [Mycena floridula]